MVERTGFITREIIVTYDVRRACVDAPPCVVCPLPMPGGRRKQYLQLFLVGGIPNNNQLFDVVNEIFNLKFSLGIELIWLPVKLVPMHICSGVAPGHIEQHHCLTSVSHQLISQATPNVTQNPMKPHVNSSTTALSSTLGIKYSCCGQGSKI